MTDFGASETAQRIEFAAAAGLLHKLSGQYGVPRRFGVAALF